ncbi:MAG: hypothetical protein WBN59_01940, partial [Flavobacteriaceae bacterium]
MKTTKSKPFKAAVFVLLMMTGIQLQAQLVPGIYTSTTLEGSQKTIHSITLGSGYLVYNIYRENPPEFISSWGGFYTISDKKVSVSLEFNSSFETDQLKQKELNYSMENQELLINDMRFDKSVSSEQALDGYWLFATRGPDTGQERRGDDRPRKTLKVLMDGSFQWIAYHTESFKFMGTGGGSYTA